MKRLVHVAIGGVLLFAFSAPSWSDEAATRRALSTHDLVGTLGILSTNNFNAGETNGFFANLGTNGRTCGTCHVHDEAETLTPAHVRRVARANPRDPLFAPVDGSDCPATRPNQRADASRSSMLLRYGLIRVQLAIPPAAQFYLTSATNPNNCMIPPGDPAINNQLFLFRRPLPAANVSFLSTVMWDGRETIQKIATGVGFTDSGPLVADLASQANDATLGHAQAVQPMAGTQVQSDILSFEQSLYVAQRSLGGLDLSTSNGGPVYLAKTIAPAFFIGQNDPLGGNFTSTVFTLFADWESGQYTGHNPLRAAIGRGERNFNTKTFTIANVAGLNSASYDPLANPNDPLANTPFTGTCGTCHNTPNVGNHSTALPINIGVTMAVPRDNNGMPIEGVLDIENLPIYTLTASAGGASVQVTDPGRALISGRWVDVGKTKGPMLRGLAARAPYFHNGSAKDLPTVVKFYNARFDIGLTPAEMEDLVAFLAAL